MNSGYVRGPRGLPASLENPNAPAEGHPESRAPAARATLVHRLTSILEPLDLASLFSRRRPVEVELGSGDGSFLARYAAAHPELNFLGVERLLGRLRKIDRKGLRAGLTNLRLARIEASYLIEFLLPRESIHVLHVYFPDPWPKRRHQRHRLVNERFPELAGKALVPGGRVYLRTDHADYFTQMTAVFQSDRGFLPVPTPDELSGFRTDFEAGFLSAGITTRHAAYRRGGPQTSMAGPLPS